jgi:hypothetical protein
VRLAAATAVTTTTSTLGLATSPTLLVTTSTTVAQFVFRPVSFSVSAGCFVAIKAERALATVHHNTKTALRGLGVGRGEKRDGAGCKNAELG